MCLLMLSSSAVVIILNIGITWWMRGILLLEIFFVAKRKTFVSIVISGVQNIDSYNKLTSSRGERSVRSFHSSGES